MQEVKIPQVSNITFDWQWVIFWRSVHCYMRMTQV